MSTKSPSSPLIPAVTKLSSVWEGSDWDLLPLAIPFWMRREPPYKVLDVTYGGGRFWKRWNEDVLGAIVKNDLNPDLGQFHYDYSDPGLTLKWAMDIQYDVIVFDPPFYSDKQTPNASGMFNDYYGNAGRAADATAGWSAFLHSAKYMLARGGILVAKIGNQVHNGKQRLQSHMFLLAAEDEGWHVCDEIVKVRKSPGPDNWERQLHVRKRHSYFYCLRLGNGC